MIKAAAGATRLLEYVIAGCLSLMCVLVFGNVVMRYAFNSGILVAEELSRMLFVWLVFLGAIVAMRERAHLGADMLVRRLPPAGQKACLFLSYLVVLLCLGMFLKGGLAQVAINFQNRGPVTGIPIGVFDLAGVVCAVTMIALVTMDAWRLVTGRMRDDELVQVVESEDLVEVDSLGQDLIDHTRR